jgi:hypothetical protein
MNRLFYFSMNRLPVKGLLQIGYSLSEFEPPLFACYTGFLWGIPAFVAAASARTLLKPKPG